MVIYYDIPIRQKEQDDIKIYEKLKKFKVEREKEKNYEGFQKYMTEQTDQRIQQLKLLNKHAYYYLQASAYVIHVGMSSDMIEKLILLFQDFQSIFQVDKENQSIIYILIEERNLSETNEDQIFKLFEIINQKCSNENVQIFITTQIHTLFLHLGCRIQFNLQMQNNFLQKETLGFIIDQSDSKSNVKKNSKYEEELSKEKIIVFSDQSHIYEQIQDELIILPTSSLDDRQMLKSQIFSGLKDFKNIYKPFDQNCKKSEKDSQIQDMQNDQYLLSSFEITSCQQIFKKFIKQIVTHPQCMVKLDKSINLIQNLVKSHIQSIAVSQRPKGITLNSLQDSITFLILRQLFLENILDFTLVKQAILRNQILSLSDFQDLTKIKLSDRFQKLVETWRQEVENRKKQLINLNQQEFQQNQDLNLQNQQIIQEQEDQNISQQILNSQEDFFLNKKNLIHNNHKSQIYLEENDLIYFTTVHILNQYASLFQKANIINIKKLHKLYGQIWNFLNGYTQKKQDSEKQILKQNQNKQLIIKNVINILLIKNLIKLDRQVEDCSVSAATKNTAQVVISGSLDQQFSSDQAFQIDIFNVAYASLDELKKAFFQESSDKQIIQVHDLIYPNMTDIQIANLNKSKDNQNKIVIQNAKEWMLLFGQSPNEYAYRFQPQKSNHAKVLKPQKNINQEQAIQNPASDSKKLSQNIQSTGNILQEQQQIKKKEKKDTNVSSTKNETAQSANKRAHSKSVIK